VSATVWMRRAGLLAVGMLVSTTPVLLADQTADDQSGSPARTLAAAAAWSDVLEATRAPQLPPPADTESAIVVLNGPAIAAAPTAQRQDAAARIALQQAAVEPALLGLGATVNFRYRVLVNGFGIRVPAGRLGLVAALPEVKAIYPVTYLAPAQTSPPDPQPKPLPGAAAAAAVVPAGAHPATIALIDAGVQAQHPWLGGGIGPNRLIVGGADFVNGNPGPQAGAEGRFAEAHGTELAGLVLRSPALTGLPASRVPRMVAYRVVAREFVDGRVRPLARSDRVVAAFERAVDPNGDGNLGDRADVILLGVARGFDGGGADPVQAAADAADGAGSLVVAPAGNDGPTFGATGTVAGPAASEHVLTVGAVGSDRSPRTADLDLAVGPASAQLRGLPLIGPDPPKGRLPVVVLAGADGLARGDDPRDYADAQGRSRVAGAIAVVGRGGGTLAEKSRAAGALGAAAVAVWDQDGAGLFPGVRAGADYPVPVIGLGARQGEALVEHPGFLATVTANATSGRRAAVPSFSSRGPTAEGRLKPDLVAPGVDIETAYPGREGEPLVARMSGTSAAAAQVAAMALRVRVDRPDLSPAEVRSLMVQAAAPLAAAAAPDQGAGVARMPAAYPVALEPAVISGVRLLTTATRLSARLHDLTGAGGTYRIGVSAHGAVLVPPGPPVTVPPGGTVDVSVTVPPGAEAVDGTLHVLAGDGRTVGFAPVYFAPRVGATRSSLGRPQIRITGDVAEMRVAVGLVDAAGGRLTVAPLHAVGLWLVPAGGGAPIRMAGDKQAGDWPAGTYRFMLTRRRVDGQELPAGRYRMRVSGIAADGTTLTRESASFLLP
jgi:hypothetical protein